MRSLSVGDTVFNVGLSGSRRGAVITRSRVGALATFQQQDTRYVHNSPVLTKLETNITTRCPIHLYLNRS